MPIYSVQGPDGRIYDVEGPAGASEADIANVVRRQFLMSSPAPAPEQKSGILGALGKGTESLLSSLQTAGSALFDPEAAAKAGLQREEALSKKYAEQVSLDKLKKVYDEQGLLPAAKELIGQIPAAIAEQAPNIASTIGSARAGAALGSLAGPIGGVVGGVAGAALPTLISQFGSNIERQAAEQTAQGSPLDISRASALGAAVPQAALDVAGTFIPLGGRLVSKLTGIPEKALALGAGNAAKLAEERLATTLLKGTAVGAAAEIPTEIAQQMLERLQAGLPLTSQDAMAEYGQTAYQVGLLGPIGAVGRVAERGAARTEVQRQKDEEAAKAAQAAEAAKNAPEALRQLDTDYRTAEQQLRTLTEQMNAAKPKKGATDQEKAAYEQLKANRAQFINETYKPLRMEYTQRKGAIDQMFEARQAELEAGTADQPTAKRTLPSDLPAAEPYQAANVLDLTEQYQRLQEQLDTLQETYTQGADIPTQRQLREQIDAVQGKMGELAPAITRLGGSPLTLPVLEKNLAAAEKQRLDAMAKGDMDAAETLATRIEDLQSRLETVRKVPTGRGETIGLFAEEPVQPEAQGLQYAAYPKSRGTGAPLPETPTEPVQIFAETKEQAAPLPEVKPAQQKAVAFYEQQLKDAEAALPDAAKRGRLSTLYPALKRISEAQVDLSRAAEDVGRPRLKPAVLDIFSPANLFNTALQNGDTKLLSDIAKHADTTALRAALDKNTSEREKLVKTLEGRLDLEGEKRERVDLFSKQYDLKQQALFKNGTYPDKELQAIYDKGGPAAVEYENVMQQVEELAKKVTTKQGNAKESLYEQMVRTYAELEALNARMESGIATPTMREKVAAAQAKLGKGEAPAERQMDAAEKYQLQRKITATTNKYNTLVGKVTPIRDQILKLYNSLYKTTKLEKPSVVAEKQKAAAEAAAKGPKAMTRTARTAARLSRGDVKKEAQNTTKMRDLARDLGEKNEEYKDALADFQKRYANLKAKYGANDPEVVAYQQKTAKDLNELVEKLGRKTPEYKAELNKQIEYMQDVLSQSKQEVPTKRTGAVTRKQSAAPKRLVSSTPESKAASAREQEAYTKYRGSLKDAQEAVQSEKEGREEERFLRGVEVESLALKPEYVGMLERGDLQGVLSYLSKDKQVDEFSRTVAARLAPLLDVTKVQVKDSVTDNDGKPVLGAATSKLIELNRDGGLSVETLLHESTHAAAERVVQLAEQSPDKLTREQKLAINELKALHARVRADAGITSKNAKGSLSEFVAEVMSNRNLQKQLAERKWRMSDMWKGVKSVIMRMLGFEKVETMFGASVVAVDQLFVPASTTVGTTKPETRTTRKLSAKDIAALHMGSNSMRQFADQFGDRIKQKDRTPEDVERIANEIIQDMGKDLDTLLSVPTKDSLDYKAMATMSDGTMYDENNPLHFIEAEPATFAAMRAMEDPSLREREAREIAKQRRDDFISLAKYFSDNYNNYTTAEMALVLKAASKWAVLSSKDGKLRLAELAPNNRHNVAVVGKDGADAVIEQLRAGKGLKQAFLDGLQKAADDNAKTNARLNGWKKFDQAKPGETTGLTSLYTEDEINEAYGNTGYSGAEFNTEGELIELLIADGYLEDRRTNANMAEDAAIKLNAGCAGTPWCTGASVSTARSQIENGDFYVYYKNGRPEVAVRMDGKDSIGEVRGNNPNQALDAEQREIAEAFLRGSEFEGADEYLDELERARVLKRMLTDEKFDDYKLLERFGDVISFDKVDNWRVERLLSFRNLRGYLRQKASSSVVEQLQKRLTALFEKAYKNDYFIGASVRLRDEDIEAKFDGKTYRVNPDTMKSAGEVTLGYTDKGDFELPALESVEKLSVLNGTLKTPKLKYAPKVTLFPHERAQVTLVLPDDAVVGTLDFWGQTGTAELKGAKTIRKAEMPEGDAVANVPNAKYMRVEEPTVSRLSNAARYEARAFVRRKLDAADSKSRLDREVKDMSKEEKTAFLDAMQDLGDVLGVRGFDARSLRDSEEKARDWIDQLFDTATEGYAAADYYPLNKKLNAFFNAQEKNSSALLEKLGAINAPNVIADAPYGQELTELPEERRFAPKDYGVQETSKNVFGFKPRRQPSDSVVAREPGIVDKVLGNMMGLAGRVQFVDQYAALDEAFKKGKDKGLISSLEATNANYLLRFGQQRSQFAGQFLTNGPVKAEHTKKDGGVETVYRSTKGTSMMDVAQALNKARLGNETEQENMFTVYLAGQRAKQVGWDKLNFSNPAKAEAEYKSVLEQLNGNKQAKDAFEEAAKLYQKYNAGLLDFLVDTGALSAKKAAELKSISYVPFYRVNNNGEVQLLIDKEHPVRIANIKDEPQLQSLVGGNTAILPVFTSSAQNTFILTGMGLRNQAVKETAFALKKLGVASVVRQGKGPASNDVVRFKKNGEDYYALIDTDMYGIPAHLIVRGMEGIKTTLPAVIKAMAIPANILRSFVVRNPAYAVRQVIRDPLNAWLTTGTDATPVLSSMKELAHMVAGRSDTERKLMETGAISSNVYSGDEQDMAKFLKDLAAGKGMWEKALARLDAFALQGDAATRAVIYRDSLDKGMTEQQALLRTLESMNFSRRGVSPSMQALSVMIPFFNAQVQGLDVLYRALKGDMPYSEQLKIREKLFQRGLMLAAGTLAYAAMMEDDEAYKRAKPEERYGNWFVHVPGVDEPVRVPIPFELGFLFKALPEAVYNMAANDEKAGKAMGGLFKLAQQTNPFGLPQAVKPLTEAVLGKSFYGGDIESSREKSELATQRYRESTTELSKLLGSVTGEVGISPITLDYLIRGYTGPLGIALASLANPLLAPDTKAEIAEPTTKMSKRPFIGGLFQPVEGRGTLDEAYDRMLEIQQTKGTFDKMVSEGRRADAQAFAQEYSNRLAAASVSGSVQKRLGELAKMERTIRAAPGLTTEQKDAQLAQLDKAKVALARQFLAVTDRTTRQ